MATAPSIAKGTAGYVWEDPGDSIMVQLGLDVIERVGAAIEQGLGGGTRGNEIGGILLGRTLPGFGRAVLVEDFELVPCEHLRGGSYTLSPRDKRVLGARLARHNPREVVGYFRSHTRPGMYLDQDDFAVFSQYFPEAWQVFLLVRPSADGPATGGFFFWEDGELNRRSTYRQFPFDIEGLAAGGFPITGELRIPPPRAVSQAVPVLVPKPEVRDGRRFPLPSLPWVVVPVIAVLFLIAGLFVSQNQTPDSQPAAAKAVPAVEPLLPEPSAQPAAAGPAPVLSGEPAAVEAPVEPKPVAAAKPKAAKKPAPSTAVPVPVSVARAPVREVEAPPALAVPVEKLEPKPPAVLPVRVNAAPLPEAEVTYEAPRGGVFKRAFRKIEGTDGESAGSVAAAPVRKVSPVKPVAAEGARTVDVKVFIDESGNVSRAQVMSKGGDLALAALNAARQWQFTPARKHGKPVSSEMLLHFRF